MTDKKPDDRELEQYLKGASPLSRRYRDASRETAPPELDETILAHARSELRRRPPGVHRWLAPAALAASVMLGVNLGWNVYKATPPPGETPQQKQAAELAEPQPALQSAPQAIAPAAPPPQAAQAPPERKARAEAPEPAPQFVPDAPAEGDLVAAREEARQRSTAEAESARRADEDAARSKEEQARQQALAAEPSPPLQKRAAPQLQREALAGAAADAAASGAAAPMPMTEPEKIERLIAFVAGLHDVAFIRNGKEYPAEEAAKHMRLKLEKAGDRVKTADDFIRLCASHSYVTKEAYLIRFPDGRTRTAEDVLREQLATMR